MTRKRFVKLLMSRGYTRNEANSKAQAAVSAGVTYDSGYFAVQIEAGDSDALEAVQAAFDRFTEVVRSFSEAIMRASKAIVEAMPKVVEMAKQMRAEELKCLKNLTD